MDLVLDRLGREDVPASPSALPRAEAPGHEGSAGTLLVRWASSPPSPGTVSGHRSSAERIGTPPPALGHRHGEDSLPLLRGDCEETLPLSRGDCTCAAQSLAKRVEELDENWRQTHAALRSELTTRVEHLEVCWKDVQRHLDLGLASRVEQLEASLREGHGALRSEFGRRCAELEHGFKEGNDAFRSELNSQLGALCSSQESQRQHCTRLLELQASAEGRLADTEQALQPLRARLKELEAGAQKRIAVGEPGSQADPALQALHAHFAELEADLRGRFAGAESEAQDLRQRITDTGDSCREALQAVTRQVVSLRERVKHMGDEAGKMRPDETLGERLRDVEERLHARHGETTGVVQELQCRLDGAERRLSEEVAAAARGALGAASDARPMGWGAEFEELRRLCRTECSAASKRVDTVESASRKALHGEMQDMEVWWAARLEGGLRTEKVTIEGHFHDEVEEMRACMQGERRESQQALRLCGAQTQDELALLRAEFLQRSSAERAHVSGTTAKLDALAWTSDQSMARLDGAEQALAAVSTRAERGLERADAAEGALASVRATMVEVQEEWRAQGAQYEADHVSLLDRLKSMAAKAEAAHEALAERFVSQAAEGETQCEALARRLAERIADVAKWGENAEAGQALLAERVAVQMRHAETAERAAAAAASEAKELRTDARLAAADAARLRSNVAYEEELRRLAASPASVQWQSELASLETRLRAAEARHDHAIAEFRERLLGVEQRPGGFGTGVIESGTGPACGAELAPQLRALERELKALIAAQAEDSSQALRSIMRVVEELHPAS